MCESCSKKDTAPANCARYDSLTSTDKCIETNKKRKICKHFEILICEGKYRYTIMPGYFRS